MIRNAEPGDRVQVLNLDGAPRTTGQYKWGANCWDFAQGNTGTVMRVRRDAPYVFVCVIPDPPNDGEFSFGPRDLRRISHA